MERYLKFLQKLPADLQKKLLMAVAKIVSNDLSTMDIKLLSGGKNVFRCRVGKIRIIFEKHRNGNRIHDIGFRGNIYN